MELLLNRKKYSAKSTIGEMIIEGTSFKCCTLEDVCRDLNRDGDLNDPGEAKVYGQTAIPAGRYELSLYNSPKFGEVLLLKNVPGYSMVEIHYGNKPEDTHGCILVGESSSADWISDSKKALKRLMAIAKPALKKEKLYLKITDLPNKK